MYKKIKSMISSFNKNSNANDEAKTSQIVALSVIALMFLIGFLVFTSYKKNKSSISNENITLAGVFDEKFNSTTDEALIERQNQKIKLFESEVKMLRDKGNKDIAGQAENLKGTSKDINTTLGLFQKKLDELESENKNSKMIIAMLQSKGGESSSAFSESSSEGSTTPNVNYQRGHLKHVRLVKPRQFKKLRTPDNYIWAGTRAEGFLMTGILGDAGINGTKNMSSGIIRLVDNGEMPNHKYSKLKDCTVTYSAYGDLSSNTGVLQLGLLSCAGDKMNLEKKVFGSVYDTDAMEDLRGTPVLNSKPMVGNSFYAGLFSGLGSSLSNSSTQQAITPTGPLSLSGTSIGDIGRTSLGNGVQNGAGKVSDYMMRLADIYHPVVTVKPGRRVTVIFLKGLWTDEGNEELVEKETTEQNLEGKEFFQNLRANPNRKSNIDELIKNNSSMSVPIVKGV